ncbi:MAG: inositol monophosphatase [Rhodothermales bacterium]|nr:inositol monophosphatase [Rhodothermales bacterium]MBO6778266.1 inositol monophosphatase [Rhodothermales bacterium]
MADTAHQVLDVAISAARQAGALIRKESGSVTPEGISAKGVHDLVTHVDKASQSLIVSAINRYFPSHLVLAEEDEQHDLTPAAPEGRWRWIIDPIDGTTNFMHGVPPYAVSIGVQRGAQTEVGVVYDVSRDELFTAVRGEGLRVNGAPAEVSGTDKLDDALITTGFPYREFAHIDQYLAVLKAFMRDARGVRRPGSASVDLAWVASGRFDGFFETGLSPWDVAAGMLLVQEGGGQVTDYSGSPDATFARQVIASNGRIHDTMREMVQPMRLVRG